MLSKVNQFTSLVLTLWLTIFTQLSVLHLGHAHDLLPVEQNMCDENCDDSAHDKAGDSCDWFIANRLIAHSGSFLDHSSPLYLELTSEVFTNLEFHYFAIEHANFSTRAPPTNTI